MQPLLHISLLVRLIGFIAPLITGLICMGLLLVFYLESRQPLKRKLSLLLIAEMGTCAFSWVSLIIYTLYPEIYIRIEALFYISILYALVITYHFVFVLTDDGSGKKFNRMHYIIPLLFGLVMLIWSFFIPDEIEICITASRGKYPKVYEAFTLFTTSKSDLFLVYNILYSIWGLKRIYHFRKIRGNYLADEGRSSINWLLLLMFVTLAGVLLSLIPSLLGINLFLTSAITFIPTFLVILKDVVLTYNVLAGNYVVIDLTRPPEESEAATSSPTASSWPDKEKFEQYVFRQKPYLNPHLRITDLAHALYTNRTYLSGFINQEYQMNFSRFINRCRLKELEKLRRDPNNLKKNMLDLILEAGFSNYRAYQRVKKEEEKQGK